MDMGLPACKGFLIIIAIAFLIYWSLQLIYNSNKEE